MIEGNELSIYGDRAVSELTTLRSRVCGAGNLGPERGHPENVRERGTLGQRLASRAQPLGRAEGARVTGRFSPGGPGREPENLENWKSDIETGDRAHQNSRFSAFQFFTRPQMHGLRGRGVG